MGLKGNFIVVQKNFKNSCIVFLRIFTFHEFVEKTFIYLKDRSIKREILHPLFTTHIQTSHMTGSGSSGPFSVAFSSALAGRLIENGATEAQT